MRVFSRLNLQARIGLTLLTFAAIVAIIISVVGYVVNEKIEMSIWRHTLEAELAFYLKNFTDDKSFTPSTETLFTTYIQPDNSAPNINIPKVFHELEPGIHDGIEWDTRQFCVLVKDVGTNRYYLVYDITKLEAEEESLALAATVAIVSLSILILLVGLQVARWLISPIHKLAADVANLQPSAIDVELTPSYQDKEIKVIAGAIDRFLSRLREFVLREKDFIGAASHELRTPIAVIAGAGDVIAALPNLTPEIERPLERIRRNVKNMDETVTALLFLIKEPQAGESTDIDSQCFLHEIIPSIVENHRHLLAGKSIALRIDTLEETIVSAPETMIGIVVGNLIRNAIQHTDRGEVTVSLNEGVLTVNDTGCGMSNAYMKRVMAKEVQVEGHDKAPTGLGLYLIRRITARFGWQINIESKLQIGTRVELSFGKSLIKPENFSEDIPNLVLNLRKYRP